MVGLRRSVADVGVPAWQDVRAEDAFISVRLLSANLALACRCAEPKGNRSRRQFIEGVVSRKDLETAITAAIEAEEVLYAASETYGVDWRAAHAATKAGSCVMTTAKEFNRDAWIYAAEESLWQVRYAHDTESGEHASLLRELFGLLPFRTVRLDPTWLAWNNATIPKLAQAIYDDRAFDRLPVLGDALKEAGCHDTEILAHCREPGLHVRGCWAVDLLLGKGS